MSSNSNPESNSDPHDAQTEELIELWQRQETIMSDAGHMPATAFDPTQLIASVRADHKAERRRIVQLNIQEVVPSVALFGVLTLIAVTTESGRSPLFVAALLCLGTGLFLLGSTIRQHRVEKQFDASIRGAIERSLSQARHRSWLYRKVGWWYLAPLVVAIGFMQLGLSQGDPSGPGLPEAVFGIGVAALAVILYRVNRKVAADRYEPEIIRLSKLLDELDDQVNGGA